MCAANENLMTQGEVVFDLSTKAQKDGIGEQSLVSMQNHCVFGLELIFFLLISLKKTKNSICCVISLALPIINPNIII